MWTRNLPVKWGISLPNRGALFGLTAVDELIETAVIAEQSGAFESVWFGDSLIHKPRLEAITMLAAVATRTQKVRLGTICMASFPVRHPVLLAIQWATLDQISKGRALLGVCIGGAHEAELRAFGVKREERVGRMKEGIELLRQIWSDEEVAHRGKYYTLEGYNIVPKPAQKPPPIWIAVSPDREEAGDKIVDQAMRRVGALADGYITMGVTAQELGKRLRVIQQTAREMGRDLSKFEVAIHGMVNINDDKRAAYGQAKDYFNHYYGPTYPPESLIKVWLAHGPPRECARLIQDWIDMGITTPVLRFTSNDQIAQVKRFIDEVLPLLRLN
ncbi:MAG TPA: LLM class flavin-dependent oxidoreductase [Candidatus Binatia bacterium]|jgi:alkanesulfonate monooxygenase SsuD/methylene tetrahydromethanopterin reductase-like flavin-dependent oxidoreductase (luciferase family)